MSSPWAAAVSLGAFFLLFILFVRPQEFAEDAERCFRATGECCFDIEAVERRMGRPHTSA